MKLLIIVLPTKKVGLIKMDFKVVERFVSINGEGRRSGQLAIFIRFAGCNLNCSYCDTLWANEKDVSYELISSKDIYDYIKSQKIKNVTLTGGEPLMQKGIVELLKVLSKDKELYVEIETNGSVLLDEFLDIENSPSFTMDYKLPSSNMENKMALDNFRYLTNIKDFDNAEKELLIALKKNRKKDLERNSTSIGPHRDDFEVSINNIDTRIFGSQGQQRTAVLTLKFASLEIIKNIIGEYPVLLLDDVLSELDSNRQRFVLNSIDKIQTIITCTGIEEIDKYLDKKQSQLYLVNNGKIKRV